jgi:hypothetical protein
MDPRTFLETLAVSVLLAVVLVVGRLLWCLVIAIRARRYQIMIISVVGLVGMVAALSAVVIVWFGYGVAHTGKNAKTDLIVLFSTVPPFFLVSFGLWLLGGKLYLRLRSRVAQQGAQGGSGSAAP